MKPSVDIELQEAARWALMLGDPDVGHDDISQALDWIYGSPDNEARFRRVERILGLCDEAFPPAGVEVSPPAAGPTGGRSWIMHPALAAAASVLLLLAGLIFMLNDVPWSSPRPWSPNETLRFASAVGQTRTVSLSDGSTVTLAGASAISVTFGETRRQTVLTDGEALFTVAHDPSRPFVVATAQGSTTALGTVFNVHSTTRGATVTVVEGRVRVATHEGGAKSVVIGPATQVGYHSDGSLGRIRHVDVADVLAWREGRFVYQSEPLGSVIADLNRYSPVPIIIRDAEISTIPVTGTVNLSGIREWLEGLAFAADIRVIRRQESITLEHARRRQSSAAPAI